MAAAERMSRLRRTMKHLVGVSRVILRSRPIRRPEHVLFVLFLLLFATPIRAHDIPQRVAAFLFVKPEARTLKIVIRVPLESMRDINFPLKRGEMLDIGKATPLL